MHWDYRGASHPPLALRSAEAERCCRWCAGFTAAACCCCCCGGCDTQLGCRLGQLGGGTMGSGPSMPHWP